MSSPQAPSPSTVSPSFEEGVSRFWDEAIIPALVEYIRIPNKSPAFDPQWREHGFMDEAVALAQRWCAAHALPGMSLEVVRLEGRTPLLYVEVPGSMPDTVLLYGHLDKQPEMSGWGEGLGPWEPVLRGDRLFGRGGADDGYAVFGAMAALRALAASGTPHARCVVLIETCEESGSSDLPAYVEALSRRIGTPSLVICLDSGCGNYEQLWCTTSLRGAVVGHLRVDILEEGVHSGDASGIIPCTFRILRELLSRIEDARTGELLVPELFVEIPAERTAQAARAAGVLGQTVASKFPFVEGARAVHDGPQQLILNRSFRPALAVLGADGLPGGVDAGNVLRPFTELKIGIRLPPTADAARALAAVRQRLEEDAPYGARVTFRAGGSDGWNAPPVAPWLEASLHRASQEFFGKEAVFMGEGGGIPFMGMLGKRYPEAQFFITGVLGPHSNAHGPNEFLHLPMGKKLSCCVARVIGDHAVRGSFGAPLG